ncbi:MAG: protein adenylyltransferase SelO family protein [Polyangiaceae bacterium]
MKPPSPSKRFSRRTPNDTSARILELFGKKLGLSVVADEDRALKTELLEVLTAVETDMAIFFRGLGNLRVFDSDAQLTEERLLAPIRDAFYSPATIPEDHRQRLTEWLRRYAARVREGSFGDDERKARMDRANPKYVLRNYVAQLAIDAAEAGDDSVVRRLLDILKRPFDEQPEHEEFAGKRPEWARSRVGCSMLSCSS